MAERKIEDIKEGLLASLKFMFEDASAAFYVAKMLLDDEGAVCGYEYIYVNHKMEEASGLSKDELNDRLRSRDEQDSLVKRMLPLLREAALQERFDKITEYHVWGHEYLSITIIPVEAYGYAVCLIDTVTEDNIEKKVLRHIFQKYRSIFFVVLDADLYYKVYPRIQDNMETGEYEAMIDGCFSRGEILQDEEGDIRRFFSIKGIREALERQDLAEHKYQGRTEDGHLEWYLANCMVIEREEGLPQEVIMTIQGIDDVVRKEEEQKRRLEEAVRKAETASRAKTDFLSSMSHDIRTPLNAIIGMSEVAGLYMDDKDKLRDCIEKINTSGRHLLNLINQVLDMSKIESGRMELKPQMYSLEDLLQELQQMMQGLALEKQQVFTVEKRLEHPVVYVDAQRLKQILLNLLSNAIKYSKEGKRIHLLAEEFEEPREGYGSFRFIVQDEGRGMSREFLASIYEQFTREQAGEQEAEGSGLGMSIVKRLVEEMKGSIDIESEKGKGTKACVSIPLFYGGAERIAAAREPVRGQMISRINNGYKVLLVEDNLVNTEVAVEILKHLGFQSETADNGQAAIERLLKEPRGTYQCVFMDLRMPVMTGMEAAKVIRETFSEEELPIFAMTANAFEEDVLQTRLAGMQEHIVKPVDIKTLQEVLEKYFPEAFEEELQK